MRRIFSFLFAIILCASLGTTVAAAISPRYIHLNSADASITIDTSADKVYCRATASSTNNLEIQIECKLQRYNNAKWNNVKTWTASGTGYVSINKGWAVPTGYDYRVYATFKVYDSNGNMIESGTAQDSAYLPAS